MVSMQIADCELLSGYLSLVVVGISGAKLRFNVL